jgi:hypothetical protein
MTGPRESSRWRDSKEQDSSGLVRYPFGMQRFFQTTTPGTSGAWLLH